ncbi:(2Fe-2S)-binding protein [Mycolicibacterium pyrenivorans]|uniref:(2Fe-2S)-binding protein n=1 Tax=Mycolicibacterium pyrenivorans TaxID=187102 RepID=UPI0021F2BC3C|nr:(2Fe-2S)-binding protein [Mycolicibacterium pyrenivorans]MCV7150204.1 (2Fe-2S)-binding protein [Mycolicibacterium pyrenivorans]
MRVEPAGIDIDVHPGETLMQAAWRAGYYWPTLCLARGTCTACRCEILDGLHLLSERTDAEVALLGSLDRRVRRANPRRIRLACQAKASGHITVRKPGVRKQSTVNDQEAANVEGQ